MTEQLGCCREVVVGWRADKVNVAMWRQEEGVGSRKAETKRSRPPKLTD